MSNGYYYCQECQNTVKFKHDCVMDKSIRIGLDINTRPHTEPYVDRMWQEYYKMKDELEMERSKRTQIEYLYDELVANVAPLIQAAKELNIAGNNDTRTIDKLRKLVKYL